MTTTTAARIAALRDMTVADLREKYHEVFGEETVSGQRRLVDEATKKTLDQVGASFDAGAAAARRYIEALRPTEAERGAASATITQKERTRALHDDLAEVINRHGASPETVLMALELLRSQALAPRLCQFEME